MSVIQLFSVAVLVGLLILHFLRRLWSRKRYPPAPFPLPVFGGIWRIAIRLYQDTLTKTGGDSEEPNISLSSKWQPTKESGKTEQPARHFLQVATFGKDVFSPVHIGKQQKQIGQATLQQLGRGKKSIEHQIGEEAHRLADIFAQAKGEPLDPLPPIISAVSSMVCATAFARQYSIKDEHFRKLTEELERALKSGGSFIYALKRMFPLVMSCLRGPQKKALSAREFVLSLIKKEIKKHKEHRQPHEPQDFIDFYLLKMAERKGDVTSSYNEENLAECILDFFITGVETTATTLQWALLLMATHPDIQDKVYKEMEDVFGPSQAFSHQDWHKLPYTSAVIHEILRVKYAFLFRIVRQWARDVNILGFLIPKGTFINPNLNSILLDPKQWKTPEEFNPNHFLDTDAKFVARKEFLLFGAGDSVSLEEQLARAEFFAFFTTLLRAFRFQLPGEVTKHHQKARVGLTTYPHSYELCAVPRGNSSQTSKTQ
ncbi:cytochrome P450 2J6 [Pogona vitticeps]